MGLETGVSVAGTGSLGAAAFRRPTFLTGEGGALAGTEVPQGLDIGAAFFLEVLETAALPVSSLDLFRDLEESIGSGASVVSTPDSTGRWAHLFAVEIAGAGNSGTVPLSAAFLAAAFTCHIGEPTSTGDEEEAAESLEGFFPESVVLFTAADFSADGPAAGFIRGQSLARWPWRPHRQHVG